MKRAFAKIILRTLTPMFIGLFLVYMIWGDWKSVLDAFMICLVPFSIMCILDLKNNKGAKAG